MLISRFRWIEAEIRKSCEAIKISFMNQIELVRSPAILVGCWVVSGNCLNFWTAAFSLLNDVYLAMFTERCVYRSNFIIELSNDVELSNSSGAKGSATFVILAIVWFGIQRCSRPNGLQIRCQFNSCKFKILFVILNYPIISLSDHSDLWSEWWSANNFGNQVRATKFGYQRSLFGSINE